VTRVRALLAGLACALAVAGCSGAPEASPDDTPSPGPSSAAPTPSPSVTPSPAPVVPAAPPAGACYALSPAQLTRPTNASSPVPCSGRHTAQTVFVGVLDTVVDGHAVAVDSAFVQRQLSTTCPRQMAAYVGGRAGTRALSRFRVVWYSPTLEQADRGADWFRCDLIAFARQDDELLTLPRPAALRGVLRSPAALDAYGLCGTAAPGATGFARVICARPHTWRATRTIGIAGGAGYPGARTVRAAGDAPCKRLARSRAPDTLRFRYGWEWPTREQWASGQRFGYCWVPA
jgi:hypothetical protein